ALPPESSPPAVMQGWNNLEIPHTIRMLVDPQHTVQAHVNRPYLDVKDDPGMPYQWWSEADNNLPEFYQELGWDVLLHLYNEFVTRFPTLVPTPKADTQQLTEIEQLEEARRHAVITRVCCKRRATRWKESLAVGNGKGMAWVSMGTYGYGTGPDLATLAKPVPIPVSQRHGYG
ncbi:hypothetical protein BU15DRAFT_62686, partial [Melanogaster broomeanus]